MRPALLAAAAVAAIAVAGACSLEPASDSADRPLPPLRGDVLLVGDSLLEGASVFGDLEEELRADGWTADVIYESGVRTSWGAEQIADQSTLPAIVVVILGSNPSPVLGTFEAEVRDVLDALRAGGAQQVVWVPPVGIRRYDYSNKARLLRSIAAKSDDLYVPPWDRSALRQPKLFAGDGLHLSRAGYAELTESIREWIDDVAADLAN